MDVFRASQRLPPRYVPVVGDYPAIPAELKPYVELPARPSRRVGTAAAVIGLVALVAGILPGLLSPPSSDPEPSRPAGGGGGGTVPVAVVGSAAPVRRVAARAPVPAGALEPIDRGLPGGVKVAPPALLQAVRDVIYALQWSPTTRQNLADRLALFKKYFETIPIEDRKVLFFCASWRQIEDAIKAHGDEAPRALDRLLRQLQVVLR